MSGWISNLLVFPRADPDLCPGRFLRETDGAVTREFQAGDQGVTCRFVQNCTLVPRVIHITGYSLFSFTRAVAVVNFQSALACFLLRLFSQAVTSATRVCLSEIRRSRH